MSKLRDQMVDLMTYRDFSPRTHESYLGSVKRLSIFYHRSPEKISREEVQDWLKDLSLNCHLSPSSVILASNGVKFLYHQVLGKENYLFKLDLPKCTQKIPDLLTRKEVYSLIHCCQNIKHYAMLSVCYGCGLRLNEVVHIKIKHLDSVNQRLKVDQGKGKKDRIVPLPLSLVTILRQYWRVSHPHDYVFYGQEREQALHSSSLQKLYYSAKKRAQINKLGGIHSLRHAYATHQLDAGMPIHQLKDILGHTDIRTTMRYLHWCPQQAKNSDLLEDWQELEQETFPWMQNA